MLSRNVKVMLLLVALGLIYTFVLGCDDTTGKGIDMSVVNAAKDAAKTAETVIKSVSKSDVRAAIKALEASNAGISASAVGSKIANKYGDSNVSGDLLKAVKARCVKMGLTASCTAKTH